jgi:hypothetical protein
VTGPEHYAESERLIAALGEQVDDITANDVTALASAMVTNSLMAMLRAAQVHATLALAAATASERLDLAPADAWAEVLT